jgi:hypothetical protein
LPTETEAETPQLFVLYSANFKLKSGKPCQTTVIFQRSSEKDMSTRIERFERLKCKAEAESVAARREVDNVTTMMSELQEKFDREKREKEDMRQVQQQRGRNQNTITASNDLCVF